MLATALHVVHLFFIWCGVRNCLQVPIWHGTTTRIRSQIALQLKALLLLVVRPGAPSSVLVPRIFKKLNSVSGHFTGPKSS